MNLGGMYLMLIALGLALGMALFIWWGRKLEQHDILTNPERANAEELTDRMLCKHDCECMADKL